MMYAGFLRRIEKKGVTLYEVTCPDFPLAMFDAITKRDALLTAIDGVSFYLLGMELTGQSPPNPTQLIDVVNQAMIMEMQFDPKLALQYTPEVEVILVNINDGEDDVD